MIYMDATKKKNIGIISFVPILAFILTFIYEYREVGRLLAVGDHHAVMNEICGCYNNLVLMYGIAVVLTLAVLLYFIIHVARIKSINAANKILWIVVLTAFMPVSFPIFWYLQIKTEPEMVDTKDDMS